jgi:hypothetical protein
VPAISPPPSANFENDDFLEYTWIIPEFSKIKVDRMYSPTFTSGPNEPVWRTLLFPYGNSSSGAVNDSSFAKIINSNFLSAADTHLSIYVELESLPSDPNWRGINVQFQFQLVNQVRPEKPFLSEESSYLFFRKGPLILHSYLVTQA